MDTMLGRLIGTTGLMAVALLPLAAAAASNAGVVQTVYSTEARVARSARQVAKAWREEAATILVDETLISAARRTPAEREAEAITVDECPHGRGLAVALDTRADEPARVRECLVAVHEDELQLHGVAVPPGSRATRSVMVFDHAPAEPPEEGRASEQAAIVPS